jgi:hypothetical protein
MMTMLPCTPAGQLWPAPPDPSGLLPRAKAHLNISTNIRTVRLGLRDISLNLPDVKV